MADFVKASEFLYVGNAADTKPTGVPLPTHCWELDTKKDYATKDGTNWVVWRIDPSGVIGALDDAAVTAVGTVASIIAYIKGILNQLAHATYGLSAIKTAIDAIVPAGETEVKTSNVDVNEGSLATLARAGVLIRGHVDIHRKSLVNAVTSVLNMMFDEGAGTKAYDMSAQKNLGTLSGTSLVWSTLGQGLTSAGNDEKVALASPFTATTVISIMAYIKRGTAGTIDAIVSTGAGTDLANFILMFGSNDKLTFRYTNAAGTAYHIWESTATYTDTNWHEVFISFTFGTPGSLVVQVDEVAVAGSWTAGDGTAATYTGGTQVTEVFSCNTTTPGTNKFIGTIGEVHLVNSIVSLSDHHWLRELTRGRYSL